MENEPMIRPGRRKGCAIPTLFQFAFWAVVILCAIALNACGDRFECDGRGLPVYSADDPPSNEALEQSIDLQLRRLEAEQSGSQWIDRDKLKRAEGCRVK